MQQASLKHFNLSHPLELRRISLPPIKALELFQLVLHPGTAHPQHKRLNIPVFRMFRGRTTKQSKERHVLDSTPPHRRKIRLYTCVQNAPTSSLCFTSHTVVIIYLDRCHPEAAEGSDLVIGRLASTSSDTQTRSTGAPCPHLQRPHPLHASIPIRFSSKPKPSRSPFLI